MNKIVSASEFKATCLKLIDEMQRTGEPVTITKRGKVVAEMTPKGEKKGPVFGSMRGSVTILGDIEGPVDPDWEAKWDAKWDDKLRDMCPVDPAR